jgi:hypothetical protein
VRALAIAAFCGGCATAHVLGPATIYEDVSAPIEYRADVVRGGREVRGEACQTGIFLPVFDASVAWGDGGYRDAVRVAQAQAPEALLTDVRADIHTISVLTIFRQQCVVVTAATLTSARQADGR